jgi:mannose-1-phosphate guanylyltransferase/mannose-6-phosphate isomerase
MSVLVPMVLCGGAGTRLWPVSREGLPKPFIKLPDGESLLLKTLRRAFGLAKGADVLAVTNRDHFFLVRDECELLGPGRGPLDFLLEPASRNTAAAIGAAALHVSQHYGDDAVLLVLPSDQLIKEGLAFDAAVQEASALARAGWLVTFGIEPNRPETGFGYLETGAALSAQACRVARFVEKPDLQTAERYVASGKYRWNAGIFCFTAGAVTRALEKYAPKVASAVQSSLAASHDVQPRVLEAKAFVASPDISFDHAVMEQSDDVAMVRADFEWNDVGSWSAIAELVGPDARGNRVNGEAVLVGTSECFIQSRDRVVAAIGVEGLMIIDTPDALLVSRRGLAQDVKAVVQRLKAASHDSLRPHRTTYRPWGTCTVVEKGDRFKIQRLVVKPGAGLSPQLHRQRSEHWVMISGAAKVVVDGKETEIRADQSTFIPAGVEYRLVNPGTEDCVMIEVQTGDYVGEDDVERLDDRYGRT